MDISQLGTLISQYGFPIVACGALFWYIVNESRENRKVTEELRDIVKANTEAMKELIELVKEVTRR